MQRLPPLQPGMTYIISSRGIDRDPIFFEEENYNFFLSKMRKYLPLIAHIEDVDLTPASFTIILSIKEEHEIKPEYRYRIYQPISNFLNCYAKAVNRKYGREGSLFRTRYHRQKSNF